jgi:hypothetical protein
MSGFREKLRRFQTNWVSGQTAGRPVRAKTAVGFKFNADDTPRSWDGDVAAFWPMAQIDLPPKDLPRFANVAAHDGQLAA